MRQCPAAVPPPAPASPVPDHVPLFALLPLDAAAMKSEGRVISTRSVPVSAAAQLLGGAPELIRSFGDVPMVVSKASSWALRTLTLYCRAITRLPKFLRPEHA